MQAKVYLVGNLTKEPEISETPSGIKTVNRWESRGVVPKFLTQKRFEAFCEKNKIVFKE